MKVVAFGSSPNGYRISHPPPASSNLNRNSIIERVPRRIRPYLGPHGQLADHFFVSAAAVGRLLSSFIQVAGFVVALECIVLSSIVHTI